MSDLRSSSVYEILCELSQFMGSDDRLTALLAELKPLDSDGQLSALLAELHALASQSTLLPALPQQSLSVTLSMLRVAELFAPIPLLLCGLYALALWTVDDERVDDERGVRSGNDLDDPRRDEAELNHPTPDLRSALGVRLLIDPRELTRGPTLDELNTGGSLSHEQLTELMRVSLRHSVVELSGVTSGGMSLTEPDRSARRSSEISTPETQALDQPQRALTELEIGVITNREIRDLDQLRSQSPSVLARRLIALEPQAVWVRARVSSRASSLQSLISDHPKLTPSHRDPVDQVTDDEVKQR